MSRIKVPKVKQLSVELIDPNSWNPNAMDQQAFERLKIEIEKVGFIDAVQVVPVDGRYRLIGGEHRWRAARELGMKTIPAVILADKGWKEEDLQKFVTVRLNVLHGELNPEKFVRLYEEMARKYGEDALRDLMGYVNPDGWKKLVAGMKDGLKASGLPEDLVDRFEDEANKVSTPDDLEKIVQKLLKEYGETLNLNFMVFSQGGKEHLYVIADDETFETMKAIVGQAKLAKADVNQALRRALDGWKTRLGELSWDS